MKPYVSLGPALFILFFAAGQVWSLPGDGLVSKLNIAILPVADVAADLRSTRISGSSDDVIGDATLTPVDPPDWLELLNEYRAAALLPPAMEDLSFQTGCVNHSTYCVKNNVLVHAEDPTLPFYTPEGDQAGRSGNVMASSTVNTTDRAAIDMWMSGPFHAVGILDPRLERTGFGSYREVKAGWQMAATLDVLRGRNQAKPAAFPVIWPANGQSMPARCSGGTRACYDGGESPDMREWTA